MLFPGRDKDLSLFHIVQTFSGNHPASLPVVIGVITGVKRPELEADNSH
jgi:hypothetical protein